jgi:hypothetical protein
MQFRTMAAFAATVALPIAALAQQPAHHDTMTAIGELICDANPYTQLPPDQVTGHQTGKMQLVTQSMTDLPEDAQARQSADITGRIAVEEGNYGGAQGLTFNGQPVHAKKSIRIPYRFAVTDKDGKYLYTRTETIIVTYAGGDGPGATGR